MKPYNKTLPMSSDAEPQAKLCPLCGKPNGCMLAGHKTYKGPCWCTTIRVPGALIALVPEAARNKACICRKCVEDWNARQNPLDGLPTEMRKLLRIHPE